MNHNSNTVELSVEYVHETDRAVLISNGSSETWIPKSQLVAFDVHCYSRGEAIQITVSEWFATQEGLI